MKTTRHQEQAIAPHEPPTEPSTKPPTGPTLPHRLPSQLPGIDIDQALQRSQGNQTLFLSVLAAFVIKQQSLDDDIRAAAGNRDWDDAKRRIHSARGLAATLGAQSLAAAAGSLESEIDRRSDALEQPLSQLQSALAELAQSSEILAAIGNQRDSDAPPPAATAAELRLQLVELERQLSRRSFTASASVRALNRLAAGGPYAALTQALEQSILAMDYRRAGQQLAELDCRLAACGDPPSSMSPRL